MAGMIKQVVSQLGMRYTNEKTLNYIRLVIYNPCILYPCLSTR